MIFSAYMKDEMRFEFLIYSRILRSVALVYTTLAAPLYLNLIGVGVAEIGVVYAGLMLFSMLLGLFLGMLGDRFGYRKALILGDLPPLLGLLLMWHSTDVYLAIIAVIVGGAGSFAGGFGGAFSAGMTAITMSNYPEEQKRIKKMSSLMQYAALGSVGGGLMLLLQSVLQRSLGDAGAYRLLFLAAALFMSFSMLSLLFVRERRRPKKTTRIMRGSSLSYTLRIILVNSVNGVALGMALPLLPLFFKIAFHLGSNMTTVVVGVVYIPAYIASSLGARFYGRRSSGLAVVRVASLARSASGMLLIGMGFVFAVGYMMPYSIWIIAAAAALYILRSFAGGFTVPSTSVVGMGGVHEEDYGTASSVQRAAAGIFTSSSGFSGYLAELWIPSPLIIGGLIQLGGGMLYRWMLERRYNDTLRKVRSGKRRHEGDKALP